MTTSRPPIARNTFYDGTLHGHTGGKVLALPLGMTSLPLILDDEPIGIILRAGQQVLRPAKIWAYCWFTDEGEDGDHTHRHLPVDPKV